MKGEKWYVKGSFTVEAACIMAAVLLSISMMIHQAARVRDETVGAMGLHEAVEKGRHEKGAELHVVASMVQDNMGRPMTLSGYQKADGTAYRERHRARDGVMRLKENGSGRKHSCGKSH